MIKQNTVMKWERRRRRSSRGEAKREVNDKKNFFLTNLNYLEQQQQQQQQQTIHLNSHNDYDLAKKRRNEQRSKQATNMKWKDFIASRHYSNEFNL